MQAISVATLGRRFTTSRTEPPILIFSVPKGCSFDVSYRQITSATDLASPHDPQNAVFNVHLSAAYYHMGRYAEAVNFGRKAIQQRFGLPNAHRVYAASLAQAGQIEEARGELALLQELHPENSIAWVEQNIPLNASRMAKLVEGLRKAGMQ